LAAADAVERVAPVGRRFASPASALPLGKGVFVTLLLWPAAANVGQSAAARGHAQKMLTNLSLLLQHIYLGL
jgi:hypothetical protein